MISIHALREESDLQDLYGIAVMFYFNPRPPRGERRYGFFPHHLATLYFNPRPPRGERLFDFASELFGFIFQSTPSARRATKCVLTVCGMEIISIHALREESDWML